MKYERIYLVTWIQRTTIHLQEMFYFLKGDFSRFNHLDKTVLKKYHTALTLDHVALHEENDFATLVARHGDIEFRAVEDGVLILSLPATDLLKTRELLETYYSNILAPALSYLFSKGAPLPKELSNIKEVYPSYLVVRNAKKSEVDALFTKAGDEVELQLTSPDMKIAIGEVLSVVNIISPSMRCNGLFESVLSNIVFLREYEKQLQTYLNMHRLIWDEVSHIRETRSIRYKNFPRVRKDILDFLKTLYFVKARLNQMGDISDARFALLRGDVEQKLKALHMLRFENVRADQKYLLDMWNMTIEYVNGTLALLESLYQENTQRELNALKFITILTFLTGYFGMNIPFPWDQSWDSGAFSSISVTLLIASLCIFIYLILRMRIYNRTFDITKGS